MVSPTFFMRSSSDCIYVSMYCADGRLKVSSGIKVPHECFNAGKIVNPKKNMDVAEAIARFEYLKGKINRYVSECLLKDAPVFASEIRDIVNKPKSIPVEVADTSITRPSERGKKKLASPTLFFKEYDNLITLASQGKLLTPEDTVYTPDTLKVWKTNRRLLYEFYLETATSVEPQILTLDTVKAFTVWMNSRNYSLNYVGIMNRHWKYIVRLLYERKFHTNIIWTEKKWKAKFEVVEYPHLTEDEIMKLWQYQCPNGEQERARDRWMLEYCTGLRVKDSLRMTMEHLGEKNITIVNNKTGKQVVIPYHPILQELLEKYGGQLPPKQSEQKINENMKKVAKAAGITDMYTYAKTVGGRLQHVTRPRYELVTNHTARRSIVSNMISNGISHDQGGDIVGMTQATWGRYNKNSKVAKAQMVQNTPMFRGRPKLKSAS